MLKVILHGCNGRMGKVLQQMIASSDNITVVAGIDRESEVNNEFPIYNDLNLCTESADVVIDFSNHAAVSNL